MKVIFEKYGLDQWMNVDVFPIKRLKHFVYEKCVRERMDHICMKPSLNNFTKSEERCFILSSDQSQLLLRPTEV